MRWGSYRLIWLMRYRLLVFHLIAALLCIGAEAQTLDARSVFLESPDYVIPALGGGQKQDLISHYDADPSSPSSVQNVYGAQSSLLRLTADYLHIRLDEYTDLQIKLLPLVNNTPLICMVVTSTITPAQSVISFYDLRWLPIPSDDLLQIPGIDSFLIDPRDEALSILRSALVERGSLRYRIHCDADAPRLRLTLTTFEEEMARQLHPDVQRMLKPDGVVMKWDRSRFVPES